MLEFQRKEFLDRQSWASLAKMSRIERALELNRIERPQGVDKLMAVWGFRRPENQLEFFECPREFLESGVTNATLCEQRKLLLRLSSSIRDKLQEGTIPALLGSDFLVLAKIPGSPTGQAFSNLVGEGRVRVILRKYKSHNFVALYDHKQFSRFGDALTEKDRVYRELDLIFARTRSYQGLYASVPTSYYSNKFNNSDILNSMFLEAREFDPLQCTKNNDRSFWPWQRCFGSILTSEQPIFYRSIETTSLVFDIRRSGQAMKICPDQGVYAEFIDQAVDLAREIGPSFGGYFDKETGDGVVISFSDPPVIRNSKRFTSTRLRAFFAAQKIIREVTPICRNLQKSLALNLRSIGPSVGINCGDAVWIVSPNQVRAIGDSVVLASRLAENAPKATILMSNSVLNRIRSELSADVLAGFDNYRVKLKEYGQREPFYAAGIRVVDD